MGIGDNNINGFAGDLLSGSSHKIATIKRIAKDLDEAIKRRRSAMLIDYAAKEGDLTQKRADWRLGDNLNVRELAWELHRAMWLLQ